MLRTELVKQEVFYPKQITTENKRTKLKWVEKKEGWLGHIKKVQVAEEVTEYKFTPDWEGMKDLPEDALQYFKNTPFYETKGWNWGGGEFGISQTMFIRPFTVTLNKFYQDNKVTQKNLIRMEECKDGCMITAAYVTWDDGT